MIRSRTGIDTMQQAVHLRRHRTPAALLTCDLAEYAEGSFRSRSSGSGQYLPWPLCACTARGALKTVVKRVQRLAAQQTTSTTRQSHQAPQQTPCACDGCPVEGALHNVPFTVRITESISSATLGFSTTYAFGSSPATSSGMPITAASATAGCCSNSASSSAGGT